MGDRLIIFARYPRAGKVKTRLIPALGAQGAADLHTQMVEHTLTTVRDFWAAHTKLQSVELVVSVAVEEERAAIELEEMKRWLGDDLSYQSQAKGDLGQRMAEAFHQSFEQGIQQAVIIGTDCPDLTEEVLSAAFEQLQTCELVLGPAIDGGYYLIGLQHPVPDLFVGVTWGTDRVFEQTMAIADRLNLSVAKLPPLGDVDRPEDLPLWEGRKRGEG